MKNLIMKKLKYFILNNKMNKQQIFGVMKNKKKKKINLEKLNLKD